MTVSYSALFLALLTITRDHEPDEDHPAQLIEEKAVMRDIGIPRILDPSWVPGNLTPSQAGRLHHFIAKVRLKPNTEKAEFVHSGIDSVGERKIYKAFFPKISRKINSLVELAMTEHGAHPQEILKTSRTDDFPMPDQLSNLALVPIMISVFGDSVHNGSGVILDRHLHGVAKSFLNAGYVRLRKQWARARSQIDEKIEYMEKLMKPLRVAIEEEDDVRLKDIRMAISACRTVHNMACWLPSYQLDAEANINLLQSAVDNALKMPDDAKTDAVHSIKPNAEEMVKKARAAGRQLRIAKVDLANKEEVSRTLQEIVTHLETCFGEDDAAPYALRNIDDEFGLDGDLGVEFAAKLSYEDLQGLLGFIDGRPASWNPYVRIDGRTEWQIIDAEEEIEDLNNANGARAARQPTTAASASSPSPMSQATGQPDSPAGVDTTTASSPSPMSRATGQPTTAASASSPSPMSRATGQPTTAASASSPSPMSRATGQPTTAASASSPSPMSRATGQPDSPAGVDTTTSSSALRAGFQNGGPGFLEQRLLWHQLAGTCGIVRGMWTSERGDRPPGTLLADGVGVGKTAQVMASIAFIQQVYLIETTIEEGNTVLKRPPIISQSKWFMGGDSDEEIGTVPNLAHLIVVPLSLISQWLSELHRFFRKGAVDIFVLPNTADAVQLFFFGKNTAWKLSQHKEINHIVLCAHSTFTSLTARTFRCGKDSGLRYVDQKRDKITSPPPPRTIFDINWCSVWIDEAHLFRGLSRGFTGAIAIEDNAYVVNCITATPLYTQIRDIFNMARMIAISRFSGPAGAEWERELNSRIAKEKRANSKADKDAASKRTLAVMAGQHVDDHTPGVAVRATQYSVIREIQFNFHPHLIRRTMASKQPDGRPINDKMPSITSHVISITLTERELKNLNILTEKLGQGGRTVPTDLNLKNFWLVYRTGVVFYKDPGQKNWPIFDERGRSADGGSYRKFPSSKLDTLGLLLKHLLKHDDIGHPTQDEDGHFIWPDVPFVPEGQVAPRRRRILVYHEFTMMVSTISSILAYKGIKTLIMNGTLKREERDQVIDEFVHGDDPEKRVLLFSSVGAVGLNLTCADVVIMLDTIWSQVGVEQIIGRSARLTQDKPVHVYYLIALQTTDVLMSTLAREKGEMLETLLTKGTNPALQKILDGDDDDDDEDIEIDMEKDEPQSRSARASGSGKSKRQPPKAAAKGKGKKAQAKRATQLPAADEGSSEEEPAEEPAKGKGKKAQAKRATQLPAADEGSSEEEPAEEPAKGKGKKAQAKRATQLPAADEGSSEEEPAKGKGKAQAKGKGKGTAKQPAKGKGKSRVKSKDFIESSEGGPAEPAKEKTKTKMTAKRASKEPETNAKKRTKNRTAARDSKKDISDMDEEGDEELGKMAKKQRTVVHPSGEESESDEKAAAAVRASQLPADSSNDAREAMDVDEQSEQCEPPQARVSVTPPPCGQPPRATQAPPSSMQTTGATQGSTGTDPMSQWDHTQDMNTRTPRFVDIRDGSVYPPVVHPPSDALAEWRETLREFIRESQFEVDENVLVGTPPLSNSGLDANMLAASINDISMYEESPPPPSGGTPPRSHKHSRPPEEVSPKADRRAHKRTAPSSEGEDFTTEMAGVRDSSPTNNNPYNLAIGATSQVDEPVPPLAFKPIKSKKDGMRSKTGSSKAGSSKHRSSTRR